MESTNYNDRLFSNNFRGALHFARFKWLNKSLQNLKIENKNIIELGCYDGKTMNYLPSPPSHYLGLDANWENGLDIARKKWQNQPEYIFQECNTPSEIPTSKTYDIAICMETLEHVPPEMVEPYLEKLSQVTNGYIFISVPNEKGSVGLFKHLAKRFFVDGHDEYTMNELMHMTLGNMNKVSRNEHKGFDYNKLIQQTSKYFDIVKTSGFPLTLAPKSLNFGVGIIAKSKTL